jgi:predicted CoA-binding protein
MMKKKTLVLGASTKPERYSYKAIKMLRSRSHPVTAIGMRQGKVDDVEIVNEMLPIKDLDTVTMYLSPINQEPYYQYLVDLKPKRVIFNPGTENFDLMKVLKDNDIAVTSYCTLVLLSTDVY